jgi:hypothetical protein
MTGPTRGRAAIGWPGRGRVVATAPAWSIVGGSALLVRDVPPTEQLCVQGGVEAWVWGAAAPATFTSTQLLALGGVQLLEAVCVILVAVTSLSILRARVGPTTTRPI